jgi:hypothetical protein
MPDQVRHDRHGGFGGKTKLDQLANCRVARQDLTATYLSFQA